MLEQVSKKRAYEEIIAQFENLMRTGKLQPGDRLPPERTLAEELNVSRTTIREALRAMETMGYIESNMGGGTFVRNISLSNIVAPFSAMVWQDQSLLIELIEVRRMLETQVAAMAAKNANQQCMEALSQNISSMRRAIEAGENGLDQDNEFHQILAQAAGNRALCLILDMCAELLSKTRTATMNIPSQPAKTAQDHALIYQAVLDGDAKRAAKAMDEHLAKARVNLEWLQNNQGEIMP